MSVSAGAAVGVSVRPPAAAPSAYSALDFRKDFFFRRRHGALDWHRIRCVDLDRVVRTVDVDSLQENVEHITFADITEKDLQQLTDANFLQLFRMTQLMIEYLLNVQNFLLASAKKKEATYEQILAELEATRAELVERTESERTARKELKYCRRVIKAYERNLSSRADPVVAGVTPKCGVCGSVFVSQEYLISHYRRRHPNEQPPTTITNNTTNAHTHTTQAQPQPQPTDLAAFKREIESALRAQLADSQRRSDKKDDDSELSSRLAKLESTLAAVLNNNALPAAPLDPSPLAASRAGALRDDDGGARIMEENGSLKEYLRRELFDLREEVSGLREETQKQRREQAYLSPYIAPHEPLTDGRTVGANPMSNLSPASDKRAQDLLDRFRSPLHPHPPSQPHAPVVPHGVDTIPRHVPQAHLTPVAPQPREPLLPTEPHARRKAREIIINNHDKRFTLFPDLPGLLSRFPHSESELVGHLNSFAVLSATLAAQDAYGEVEEELRRQGCEELLPTTEQFVDEYVRAHYHRSPELIQQFKAHAERSARFDELGSSQAARDAFEAEQRLKWQHAKAALEAARQEAEAARLAEEDRIRADRAAAYALDRAAQERLEQQRVMMRHATPEHAPQTNQIITQQHQQPPPITPILSPQTTNTNLNHAPQTRTTTNTDTRTANNTLATTTQPYLSSQTVNSSPPYAASTPSAAAAPTPTPAPAPVPVPAPAPSPSSSVSTATARPEPVQSTSRPSPFSNNPDILNPTAIFAKQTTQPANPSTTQTAPTVAPAAAPRPTLAATNTTAASNPATTAPAPVQRPAQPIPTKQPVSILKRPTVMQTAVRDFSDDDDDDDDDEKKAPLGSAAQSTNAKPNLFSPPSMVPVAIPARPNKAAIAALSQTNPSPPIPERVPSAKSRLESATAAAANSGDKVESFNGDSDPPMPTPPRRTESRRLTATSVEYDDDDLLRHPARQGSLTNIPDTRYEYSTARQDVDGDDALEQEYSQREAERAEQQQQQHSHHGVLGLGGDDDVHHFSPPTAASSPDQPVTRFGRSAIHSDDEDGGGTTSRVMIPPPMQLKTRNMGDLRNISTAQSQSRFTNQSANFSVTNSSDWKSDASDNNSNSTHTATHVCQRSDRSLRASECRALLFTDS